MARVTGRPQVVRQADGPVAPASTVQADADTGLCPAGTPPPSADSTCNIHDVSPRVDTRSHPCPPERTTRARSARGEPRRRHAACLRVAWVVGDDAVRWGRG